uniref:URB1 central HEAT repeat domain-containing protein n=1 Tax=Eptatretus burgeri TaxID=7764 RepID=A0A8C4RBN3_EPTBU
MMLSNASSWYACCGLFQTCLHVSCLSVISASCLAKALLGCTICSYSAKIYEAQPVLSKALQSCHSIPIPRLVSMVLVTTVPPVLDRSTVSRGLMNPHVTVRQATLGLLLFVLRRLQNNMRWSQTEWLQLDLRSEAETLEFLTIFRDSLGKMLPDMTTIISTWHRASTQVEIASTTAQDEMTTRGDDKHVGDPQQVLIQSMILEVLLLYQHLIPHVVAQSSFDFTKLLQSIVGDDGKAHPLVQRRVLDLLLALPTGKFSWFRTRSSVCTQVPEEGEGKQSEHSMFLLVLQMFVTTEETQLRCSSQNLLLKVLDESGLFNFASHELHIWLQELLHVPLEGRNCVLILLERALCRLLTKPHVYTDLVAKWIRDAAVLQASLAVPELESCSVSISNIDEAFDVIDVLMDSNEDLNDELEDPLDPMQLAASFPFSALVPATLDTWNHIAQSCSTTLGPMCEYLVNVLVCILHLQLEPLPLCLALQHQDEQFTGLVSEGCAGQRKADDSEPCLSRLAGFHVYYSSWIPPQARLEPVSPVNPFVLDIIFFLLIITNFVFPWLPWSRRSHHFTHCVKMQFSGIAAIPLIGKEGEAGKSGELWHRLCAAYSRGEACFLEPDVQLSLKEAAAAAPRADLRPAIFHVLLYLRTCVDCFGQHKRAVGKALLSFYLELLQKFLEVSRISKEEAETTEPRNSLKVSEDDADTDMCTLMGIQSRDENNGEVAGIKNESEAQSAMDLARAILEHPILDSWFLAAELGRFPAHSLRPSALRLVSKTLSLGAAELVRSAALLGAGVLLQVQWYTKRALVACEREVGGTADTPSLAHSSSALRCLSTLYDCTGAAQRAEVLHLLLGLPKHLLVFTLEEFEPTTLTVYGKALLAMVTSARLEELQVLSCNELAQLVEMLSYSPDADAESLLDALTRLVCEVTLWADLLPHTLVSLCLSLNTPSALRLTAELVRHSAAHCYAWEQWLLSHGAVRRLRQQLSVCWLIVSAHLDALEKHGVSLVGDHRVLNRLWNVLSPVLTRALSMTEDQTSGSEDQAVIDQEATQITLISRLLHIRPPPSWDHLLYKLPCLLQNPKQALWWTLVDGEMNREAVMNPTLRDDLAVAGLTAILASLGQGSASRGHITSIAPRLLRLLDDGAKVSAALWNKFLKSALKFGLTDGPLLALLNSTMRRVYVAPPSGLLSFTKIHALLCSHSMFVSTLLTLERNEMNTCGNIDLQQRMDVKRELVKLLLFVIEKEPSVCQSEHFPVLLGAYQATLDSVDCQLLFLLQFYENHDVRLSNLRMLLWGEAVTEQRQKRETLGFTLWQEPSSRHVLSLLQHDRMLNTALRFPLKRRLMPPVSSEEFSVQVFGEESENIYDPCFLLPLFSTLAAPGSDLDCHYFTSMNGLAVVLAALASYDPAMRSAAYHVLAAFYAQLEGARFREKAEVTRPDVFPSSAIRHSACD